MKGLLLVLLALVVLVAGMVVLVVASSPDPAFTAAGLVLGARVLVLAMASGAVARAARALGAERRAPYRGRHSAVFRPTRVGRWLGLLAVTLFERGARSARTGVGRDLVRMFAPRGLREKLAQAAGVATRVRRCLNGVTWNETDVHRLCGAEGLVSAADLAVVEEDAKGTVTVLRYFDPPTVAALLDLTRDAAQAEAERLADADGDVTVRADFLFWRDLEEALRGVLPEADAEAEEAEEEDEDADVFMRLSAFRALERAAETGANVATALREILDEADVTVELRERLLGCIADLEGPPHQTVREEIEPLATHGVSTTEEGGSP